MANQNPYGSGAIVNPYGLAAGPQGPPQAQSMRQVTAPPGGGGAPTPAANSGPALMGGSPETTQGITVKDGPAWAQPPYNTPPPATAPTASPPSTDPTYGQNTTTPGWDQSHYSTYQGGQQQDISINQMPGYQDYQNFGTASQLYGQQAVGALNGAAVTGSMAQQNSATALLGQAAAGNAPSAAQMQQTAGIQQGLSQAQAQAASTRGNFGLANAQKNAQAQQATAASATAQQNSVLRAQEMATAQQGYASAAGSEANSALANQSQNTGVLEQNSANALQQSQLAAGLATSQATTNLGQNSSENQRAMASAAASGATTDAIIGGVATLGAASIAAGSPSGGGGGSGGGSSGAGAAAAMSDVRSKWDIRPADVDPRSARAALVAGPRPDRSADADRRSTGAVLAGSPIMAQLDHFTPEVFRYKDPRNAPNPEAGNAPHLGVMAQDVERGPAGVTLVKHDAQGMKHLDVPAMVGTLAAGAGALKQRTDDHEDRLRRLEAALGGR